MTDRFTNQGVCAYSQFLFMVRHFGTIMDTMLKQLTSENLSRFWCSFFHPQLVPTFRENTNKSSNQPQIRIESYNIILSCQEATFL